MSFLISELNQIVNRIVVITPRKEALVSLFENMSLELTVDIAQGQNLALKSAACAEGALATWVSFTLGRRAGLDVRLHVMGYSLDHAPPSDNALELCDGVFVWIPENRDERHDTYTDRILTLKPNSEAKLRPWVVSGLAAPIEGDLRRRSLREWTERNFPKLLQLPADSRLLLKEGLEWVLSF
jgi:hypothetical protein